MNEHASLHSATDDAVVADELPGNGVATAAVAAALPRLALGGDQLNVWNALVRSQGKLVHAGPLQLVFEQAPVDSNRPFRQRVVWKDAHGEHFALLALEEFSFKETHGADLTMDSLAHMPAAIADVLEKSALDLIAERLDQSGLKGRHVGSADAAALDGGIEVRVRIGGLFSELVGLRLKATPTTLALLADADSLLKLSGSPEIASQISVLASIELGPVILPVVDVAGLEAGDVLLLAEQVNEAPVRILAVGRSLQAMIHEERWMIRETGMVDEGPLMSREETDLAEIGSADQLPVRVHAELASLDLPISELAAWTPGTLVDLGLGPLSNGLPVTLRVGGKKLAFGNLITIDDRFAVRLSAVGIAPVTP